jgi:hypothetical protein
VDPVNAPRGHTTPPPPLGRALPSPLPKVRQWTVRMVGRYDPGRVMTFEHEGQALHVAFAECSQGRCALVHDPDGRECVVTQSRAFWIAELEALWAP